MPYGKGWSLGGGGGLRGLIKWNPKNLKIYQNKPFRLKVYPLFRFWPNFRQSNPFRHNRGRSKMSNFGFRLNRNRIQELVFGFGSGCFKSNFVCSLPRNLLINTLSCEWLYYRGVTTRHIASATKPPTA